MAGPVALVGRERELSRLLDVLGGDARMLLVSGVPEWARPGSPRKPWPRAAAAGMVLVRGECLALAGTLPLLPVAAALKDLGPPPGRRTAGGGAGGRTAVCAAGSGPAVAATRARRGTREVRSGRGGAWQQERLFSAVADLLGAVARRAPVGLVIEDVHWADSATLDCLTFLTRARSEPTVTVVATCRSDEAPLACS